MVGRVLGRYRILEKLGAGGMGEVWRARDDELERDVALKILPPGALEDTAARARLRREAVALSQLNHPHICTVYEVGESEGRAFIAMEKVEGRPLSAVVAEGGLPAETATRYGAQIADALAHAHQRGIAHCDLKASNVMITPEGCTKVLDFGLAKRLGAVEADATKSQATLTEAGAIVGTLAYMAPETLRGEPAGERTDIWSLGVLLYEMVAGQRPFSGKTGLKMTAAILHQAPAALPETVPAGLRAVIEHCLRKDSAERYHQAGQVQAALEVVALAARPRRWKAGLAVAAGLLALIAAALLVSRPKAGKIESLAVLPLENLSGNAAEDYFADGVTDTLIADLAKIGGVRVVSRSTVMRFKGSRRPPAEVARELGVEAIVEGSVARAKGRVRITVRLVEPRSNRQMWARNYERDLRDIVAVQREAARAIAGELGATLVAEDKARPGGAGTVHPDAYDRYLLARFHLGREGDPARNQAAITALEEAVRIDPGFGPAWRTLGHAYGKKVFFFAPKERQWEERAFVALEKAVAIEGDSGEAHYVRGLLLWGPSNRFPHVEAIQEYRRALALDPSLDDAHHQIAVIAFHIGMLDLSGEEIKRAIALNPGNTLARGRIGAYYAYRTEFAEALAAFERVPLDAHPLLWSGQVAWSLYQLGRRQEARARIEATLRDFPADDGGFLTGMLALIQASEGNAGRAEELIRRAEKQRGFGHFHHTAYMIASAWAQLKRPQQAVEWLRESAGDGFPCYPLFTKDRALDPIRGEAQFAAFLADQKTQWEQYQRALSQ